MAKFKINPGTLGEKQVVADDMTLVNDYWFFAEEAGETVYVVSAKGVNAIERV